MTEPRPTVKEITVGLSGVIPIASYENLRPSFSITIEPNGMGSDECFRIARDKLRELFSLEENRAKSDLIEKQYQQIRFYEKDGKKYPSVTSITGWDKDWKIQEHELKQYGARGTIVHKLIEIYLKEKKWVNPEDVPELKEEMIILHTGSLNLSWQSCSFKKFFEKYGDGFTFAKTEQEVYNDEHLYAGRYDAFGTYKGVPSLIDFKTGTSYHHKQLAAYAVNVPGAKQTVVCPVGPTTNKSGCKKPDVSEAIQNNFKAFLKDRVRFRKQFGI